MDSEIKEGAYLIALVKTLPAKFKKNVVDMVKRTKKTGQDDPRRIVHSIKVGLAITLVSMVYYFRPIYDGFGESAIWAVLTVVVVFEFTVGATLSKCMNRGFATFTAGVFGIGAEYVASRCGSQGKPIVLGCLVFLLAAAATFLRFCPRIQRKYDYGVLVFILTFSLVSISGYRAERIINLVQTRLLTIVMGGATCMVISVLLCPIWAGEELQNLIVLNLEKLASFLEGFGGEYFELYKEIDVSDASKDDKSFLTEYTSVLNSKSSEESLANFAWWEPGHGKFRLRHPLKQYLKIGVLIRQCAYHIEALNSYLEPKIHVPSEFQRKVKEPCMKMSSEAGIALRELALSVKSMSSPPTSNHHVEQCKMSIEDLNAAVKDFLFTQSDFLEIHRAATVTSILIDVARCVEKISIAIHELSDMAHFRSSAKSVIPEEILHLKSAKPIIDSHRAFVAISMHVTSLDSPESGNVPAIKCPVVN